MLLKADILAGIRDGRIDRVFRLWQRATVKAGGTLRTAIGVLAIEAVEPIAAESLDEDDARQAGFPSLPALRASLDDRRGGQLYRIRLRYEGADPRLVLREAADLDAAELAGVAAALERLDGKAPWTWAALQLIADRPETRAAKLAEILGLETPAFKQRVRKLKALGLTESLEIGYRLSPRGRAVLAHRGA